MGALGPTAYDSQNELRKNIGMSQHLVKALLMHSIYRYVGKHLNLLKIQKVLFRRLS